MDPLKGMTRHEGESDEIRRGVYRINGKWFYRHYAEWSQQTGPYETRDAAMEALLLDLGFKCEEAS